MIKRCLKLQMPHRQTDSYRFGFPELDLRELVQNKLVIAALPDSNLFVDHLVTSNARDILLLTRNAPPEPQRHARHTVMRYKKLRSTRENNCNVAILHGVSSLALASVKTLARFETILIPFGSELTAIALALPRFRRRNRLHIIGRTRITFGTQHRIYVVLQSNVKTYDYRRQYAPAGLEPVEIIHLLDGLDYIVLRWSEEIENGTHKGDIDLLTSTDSAREIRRRLSKSVGTFPLDVYTDDGGGGHTFNQVPYYMPCMARRMLDSATVSAAGIRSASPKWRYLSFGYHLLFHIKSRRVPPGTNILSPSIFPNPKYLSELQRLAHLASERPPNTFNDIEYALRRADAFPTLDLIGFYSNKNTFLKHRYFGRTKPKAGLVTFFVRDFGRGLAPLGPIREALMRKFDIVAEGHVAQKDRERIVRGIRGGNWLDPGAPGGRAEPIYWFVCWDKAPRRPTRRTRRKYPRVDNENVLIKLAIRSEIGGSDHKPQRLVHASDNTAEALEHIKCLGLSKKPEIVAMKERLICS